MGHRRREISGGSGVSIARRGADFRHKERLGLRSVDSCCFPIHLFPLLTFVEISDMATFWKSGCRDLDGLAVSEITLYELWKRTAIGSTALNQRCYQEPSEVSIKSPTPP